MERNGLRTASHNPVYALSELNVHAFERMVVAIEPLPTAQLRHMIEVINAEKALRAGAPKCRDCFSYTQRNWLSPLLMR